MRSELNLDVVSPDQISLEDRVAMFKKDPEKMEMAAAFVDEVLEAAVMNAEARRREIDLARKEANMEQGLKRRIGTRARGFVMRIFEVICNCTNTATAAVARPSTPSKK